MKCKETVIPEVDNTLEECTECGFFSAKCIINKEVLSYLGLGVNSTVADFEKAAIKKLIFMSKRITALEARVTVLETP